MPSGLPSGVELLDNPFPGYDPINGGLSEPAQDQRETSVPLTLDDEIASMVTTRRRASWDYFSEKRAIWDQCWDHVMQKYDATGKESWQSTVFWPDTVKVVETILANLHGALLSPKTPLEWQVKVKKYEDLVRATNDIIQNDINEGKLKLDLTHVLREMCILGTGIGKVGYEFDEDITMVKKRIKPNPIQMMLAKMTGQDIDKYGFDFTPERFVIKDWAKVNYRDRYKIFPEPFTTEISKHHWIIEESSITNAELLDLADHDDPFYRFENVTEEVLSSGAPYMPGNDPDLQTKQSALNQSNARVSYYDPDKPHLRQDYYGPAPMWMVKPELRDDEQGKYEVINAWFVVIDGKYVVCKKPNPHRDGEPPYVKFCYLQMPGDWDGIGPAELMLNLQVEKNELVNTALDNVNVMLNKVIGVLKDKLPKGGWERLVSKPGAIWPFENTDDARKCVFPIQFDNLLQDIYKAILMVDNAIQEVTGAVKATLGVGGGDQEAAGGTFRGQLMNKQVATERFMLYARTNEISSLSELWRKFYQRIYQYKSYQNIEKILGEERFKTFELIPPEELDAVADLVPLGVMTMETKAVKVAQMGEFGKQYTGRPWFKEYDLARQQWVEMGFTDPDTVIFSREEMDQFNEFKKQLLAHASPGLAPEGMMSGNPGKQHGAPGPIGGPAVEQNPAVNPSVAEGSPVSGPGVGINTGMPMS